MRAWGKKKVAISAAAAGAVVLSAAIVITVTQRGGEQAVAPEASIAASSAAATPASTPALKPMSLVAAQGDRVELQAGEDRLLIDVIDKNVVRVQVNPNGKADPDTEVVSKHDFSPVGAKVDSSSNPIVVTTDRMKVTLDTNTHTLTFYDQQGKRLLTQANVMEALSNKLEFQHEEKDRLYGLTSYEASTSTVNGILVEGTKRVRGGKQGNGGAPLVWSTAGYGILIDTIDTRFDQTPGAFTFSETSKKSAQYFLMAGKPTEIMSDVADISGKPPLFPKWAMGFTNSEWGIDEKELLSHVNTYRQKQIPLDNFTLDFDWKAWGEDQYGDFRWNDVKFPNGSSGKLKEQMDKLGVKLTGIYKPRLHVETEQGKYATEHGFWWPGKANYADYFSHKAVNDLNFALPEVRTWFFEHTKPAFDAGIVGYWNDEADEGYSTMQFMNMQKGLYEGQRGYTDTRVWSINRNFYLGAQKYAYGLWSGDIGSGYSNMAGQRDRMLTAINLGQMKWGMDTGGFQSNPLPDNYARWMEFSAFTPIFRVHAKENMQREPWVFGEKAEAASKKAIQLRYQLIPYIYSYERQATDTGIGLVKPLVFDYPEDPNVVNNVDSWMFGDYLLVSPIVTPNDATKSIYLPAGTWIDYATGDVYPGGKAVTHQVDLENWQDIPLFIKKGAIIPKQPVMNYVGEKKVTNLSVDVFPDSAPTSFTYYEDDGSTYQYEKGQFFKQQFTTQEKDGRALFSTSTAEGQYTPEVKTYLVQIHGHTGKQVTVNGTALPKAKSLKALSSGEGEGWFTDKDTYGEVTYVKVKASKAQDISVE